MAVGWIAMLQRRRSGGLFLIGELAHHFSFRNQLPIHGGAAGHFRDARPSLYNLHFQPQSIARHNRLAKPRVLDRDQKDQLFVPVFDVFENQHAGGLRHRLDDEYTRHDWEPRKMTSEERFVESDVLDTNDPLGLYFHNPVHQQKGVAMRQNSLYLIDIQDGHESRYYSSRGFDAL